MSIPSFNRILLKLSGEMFSGEKSFGIDPAVVKKIAQKIIQISNKNIEIGILNKDISETLIQIAVTEKRTKEDIDQLFQFFKNLE